MSNSSPSEQNQGLDEDQQAQLAILRSFLTTVHHFFGGFADLFSQVDDPRVPELITYPLETLFFAGILMFLCRLGARRQIALMFRNNSASAAKFQALFGTEACPHGDTLDTAFRRVVPDQVQAVIVDMVRTLIRKKVLYPFRLLGMYFVIAIDGTGRLVFPERHCPHCLTATHHGQTLYYHPVLEAKLVLANGFALSIMTEFIENPGEHLTKQDCELKAFYRLAQRLKKAFPRLPICLSLDALFAGGPTLHWCEKHHWKYMIVHKAGDIPYIHDRIQQMLDARPVEYASGVSPAKHILFHRARPQIRFLPP